MWNVVLFGAVVVAIAIGLYFTMPDESTSTVFGSGNGGGADTPDQRLE